MCRLKCVRENLFGSSFLNLYLVTLYSFFLSWCQSFFVIQGHMHLHSPFAWVTCCMKWKKLNKETSIILQLEVCLILTATNGFFNVQFEKISIFIPRKVTGNSEKEGVAKDRTFNKEKFESKLAFTSRVLFLKSLALLQKLKLCKLGKETRREWGKEGKKRLQTEKRSDKKLKSGCLGQVDFCSVHATLHSHLLDFHGITQVICQLNK